MSTTEDILMWIATAATVAGAMAFGWWVMVLVPVSIVWVGAAIGAAGAMRDVVRYHVRESRTRRVFRVAPEDLMFPMPPRDPMRGGHDG